MSEEQKHGNLLEQLITIKDTLPNQQQRVVSYILEYHQIIGLLTVKEIASKAGVGTTTVMRLIKRMGYDSFFDLKKDLHDIQMNYSDKWENVQKSFRKKDESIAYETLSHVGNESLKLIEKTITPYLVENFNLAMDLISNATRINLLGLRPYRAVAIYLELLIEEFSSNTRQLSYDSDAMMDRILQFEKDEVFIIFAFTPYSQRTIDAASIAYKKGVPIVLITDHLSCPIATYSEVILKVEASDKYFTIMPTIMLVEAIVIELGKRHSNTSIQRIRTLVETLKEKNVIID